MRNIVLLGALVLSACAAGDGGDPPTGTGPGSSGAGSGPSVGDDDDNNGDGSATAGAPDDDVPLEACIDACKDHAGAVFSRCLIGGDQALCQANYNTALVQCGAIEEEDCDEDLIEMYQDDDDGGTDETTGGAGDTDDPAGSEDGGEPDVCVDGESMCLDAASGVDCIGGQWSDRITCDSVCQGGGYDLSIDCNQVGDQGICDCRYACNPATDTTVCSTTGTSMYWCWDGGWWEQEDCQARCEQYGYDYTTGCGWHAAYAVYDCYCY